jgi:hypothetical protein
MHLRAREDLGLSAVLQMGRASRALDNLCRHCRCVLPFGCVPAVVHKPFLAAHLFLPCQHAQDFRCVHLISFAKAWTV